MTPKIIPLLTVASAILSAAVLTANADEPQKVRGVYLGTAEDLCQSNGVMFFEDRDEWPLTRDGRRALEVVRERCAKNPRAIVGPE